MSYGKGSNFLGGGSLNLFEAVKENMITETLTLEEKLENLKIDLEKAISEEEQARNDLLHELELGNLNAVELTKVTVTLRDVLKERRKYKDELAKVMTLKGFTDKYNNKLSDRRAKSVVDYLISEGIKESRLQHKGYGESRPKTVTKRIARLYPQFKEGDILNEDFTQGLSEDDQDAADQINRRTEFQVISTNFIY